MLRCGIITFSQAINYGAVFQMYALQETIKGINCEVEIIDYRSQQIASVYRNPKITELRRMLSAIKNNALFHFNFSGFKIFTDKYINWSKEKYEYAQLIDTNDKYDFFITGSDQVFNVYCSLFDYAYFLDFVIDHKKKNSYAASLGLSTIPKEFENQYYVLLKDFNNISVREESASKEINRVLGRMPEVNIDPTLMLRKEWLDIANMLCVPIHPYILIYSISEDKDLFRIAKLISRKFKYKIIYISDRLFRPLGIERMKSVNPDEWLGLIYNAKAIVTNSYHGILFSCNFHKDFYPLLLNKNSQVNSRIIDFLKRFEMDHLIISKYKIRSKKVYHDPINYERFEEILKLETKRAVNYLNKIVSANSL